MRISIGADHAGVLLKDQLAATLREAGHHVDDHGTHGPERVDYPDVAATVAAAVASGASERGVLVCGSGIGMSIAANKVPGVRAALVHDVTSARLCREHNDANVLCLGERTTGAAVAVDALVAWLGATFQGGRHEDRLAKITALEAGPALTSPSREHP